MGCGSSTQSRTWPQAFKKVRPFKFEEEARNTAYPSKERNKTLGESDHNDLAETQQTTFEATESSIQSGLQKVFDGITNSVDSNVQEEIHSPVVDNVDTAPQKNLENQRLKGSQDGVATILTFRRSSTMESPFIVQDDGVNSRRSSIMKSVKQKVITTSLKSNHSLGANSGQDYPDTPGFKLSSLNIKDEDTKKKLSSLISEDGNREVYYHGNEEGYGVETSSPGICSPNIFIGEKVKKKFTVNLLNLIPCSKTQKDTNVEKYSTSKSRGLSTYLLSQSLMAGSPVKELKCEETGLYEDYQNVSFEKGNERMNSDFFNNEIVISPIENENYEDLGLTNSFSFRISSNENNYSEKDDERIKNVYFDEQEEISYFVEIEEPLPCFSRLSFSEMANKFQFAGKSFIEEPTEDNETKTMALNRSSNENKRESFLKISRTNLLKIHYKGQPFVG